MGCLLASWNHFHTLLCSFLERRSWRPENHISQMPFPPGSGLRSGNWGPCVRFAWEREEEPSRLGGGQKAYGLQQRARRQMWGFCQRFLETTYLRATGSEVISRSSPWAAQPSWFPEHQQQLLWPLCNPLFRWFCKSLIVILNPFPNEHPRAVSTFLSKFSPMHGWYHM